MSMLQDPAHIHVDPGGGTYTEPNMPRVGQLLGYTMGMGNPHGSHDGYCAGTGMGMVLLTCTYTHTHGMGRQEHGFG